MLFKCLQCGDCCHGYGGIFVTSEEIKNISAYLNSDPDQFIQQFCSFSGQNPHLSQNSDGHCIFWKDLCTIHPVKPHICRAWPFIKSLQIDPHNWKIMASTCPGMNKNASVDMILQYIK